MDTRKLIEQTGATRFRVGESGNPDGRPRTAALSRAYRALLEEPCPRFPGKTWAQAIALTLAKLALRGNVAAACELCDRTEGKPRQDLHPLPDPYAQMSDEELAQELERLGIEPTEPTLQ